MLISTQRSERAIQEQTLRRTNAQRKLDWLNDVVSSGIVRQAFQPPHAGGPPVIQHIPPSSKTPTVAEAPAKHQPAFLPQDARVPNHAARSWLQGPLRDCAQSSNDDGALARKLLDSGAPTEETDRIGRRPLHWAALRGNFSVCLALLDAGADISARDQSEKTPLHHAKKAIIVDALLDRRRRPRRRLPARTEPCQLYVSAIDDATWSLVVDARNSFGSTALHRAAFHGREDCIFALLSGGANIAVVGKSGRSALHLACRNAHAGCVKILLRWGADESAKAFDGVTPWSEMAIAAEEKSPEHPNVVETARLLNQARATSAWGRRGWILMLMEARNRLLQGEMEPETAMCLRKNLGLASTGTGCVSSRVPGEGTTELLDLESVEQEDNLREHMGRLLGLGEAGCIRHVISFM